MSMNIVRRAAWVVLSAVVALSLGGCPSDGGDGGDGGNGDGNGENVVTIRNFSYSPRSVTIRVGESVRWVNRDFVVHTVTSGNPGDADAGDAFDSGNLSLNDEFSHTFETPGTFVYFCIPHESMASMRGATVIVEP